MYVHEGKTFQYLVKWTLFRYEDRQVIGIDAQATYFTNDINKAIQEFDRLAPKVSEIVLKYRGLNMDDDVTIMQGP